MCSWPGVSPDFSPVREMIAQGFDSLNDFLTERNSSDYFRRTKIHWRVKDQASARVSGEKFGLGRENSARFGSDQGSQFGEPSLNIRGL